MIATVEASIVLGLEAKRIDVEVDVTGGIPGFAIVGLPDTAVRESINRVKSAIKNSNLKFPTKKITVNLAPCDIKKEGPCFDLPIALGILTATGQIEQRALYDKVFCGELSLNGSLRSINGILPRALGLKTQNKKFILPYENAKEAAAVCDIEVFAFSNLSEVVKFLKGQIEANPIKIDLDKIWRKNREYRLDFSDVKGQRHIKRGLEIAACGGHNVLLIGPPGAGKTMLAKRMPTILSDMTMEESLETTKIYSVSGLISANKSLITQRPFRAPHHTISDAGLAGGGNYPRPGEISLAHNGVLFLDELPEFKHNVLEVLRQPIEEGVLTISRAQAQVTYPARFILVAAMNPCPCGYFTDPKRECHCTPVQIQRYLSKISGPLLDRIDIHLEVPNLSYKELVKKSSGETSEQIRQRVIKAGQIQKTRYNGKSQLSLNAHLESKDIEQFCKIDDAGMELLKMAILELGLSARAYDKILKLSRTIADLAESDKICAEHISEAISYRTLDRNIWTF